MGALLLWSGAVLAAAGVARRRHHDSALLTGLGNVAAGAGMALLRAPAVAAVNLVIGVALLWMWRRRRCGMRRVRDALGAKSRALREALVRRMREAAAPSPA